MAFTKIIRIASLLLCLHILQSFSMLYGMGPQANEQKRVSPNMAQEVLYAAAENGKVDLVGQALDAGAKIDARAGSTFTPLMMASGNGHVVVVRLLLERGATVVDSDKAITPLHRAASHCHEAVVRLLLESGSDVNARAHNGYQKTALHLALEDEQNDNVATMRVLLEKGASINDIDLSGWMLLHKAAKAGHLEAVQLFLERGALVNAATRLERTPLWFAQENARPSVKARVLALLLLYGANRGDLTEESNRLVEVALHPLEWAALNGRLYLTELVRPESAASVKMLRAELVHRAELAKLNREDRNDLQLLSKVLAWSAIYSPQAIDYLIAQGGQVDQALRVVTGLLLRPEQPIKSHVSQSETKGEDVLSADRRLFNRLIAHMDADAKKELLSELLVKAVCCKNVSVTRFLLEQGAPTEKAFLVFETLFAYGEERAKLKAIYSALWIKAPLVEKMFRSNDQQVCKRLMNSKIFMPEDLERLKAHLIARMAQNKKRYFDAVRGGNSVEVKDLLECAIINPLEQDDQGRTGFDIAKAHQRKDLMEMLKATIVAQFVAVTLKNKCPLNEEIIKMISS